MGTAPSTGEGRIRAARFPARKSLEDFDYDHARGLKRETIAHLGALDFVLAKENVILLGPPGTGKTHLAHHLPLGGPGGRPSLSPPRRRLPADTGGARLGRGPWPLAAGPWFEIPRSRVQVPVACLSRSLPGSSGSATASSCGRGRRDAGRTDSAR
ncbi:ATP-binding protein [Georgenia sp. TF02-10]|uniref:ATP-binding protein n=1 Tax=Georgenia sp. TF02-10 TaxID=2917725 RepID=UPI0027393EAB|nr:ATP-binding protein [Georgenia sp. TF02-10]